MTQLQDARAGRITPEMELAAKVEGCSPGELRARIAAGTVVLPCNRNRKTDALCAVGEGMRIKVNANLGSSMDHAEVADELVKLRAAEEAGADTAMDLSTGGDIDAIRRRIIAESKVTLGTVPIYYAAVRAVREKNTIMNMTAEDMLEAVRVHCEDGIDFITVHCGVTREVLRSLEQCDRVCGIVSRGGTFLAEWMRYHRQENPLYERYDEVLDIAREHDATLSLGDGLRPGALADAFDRPQVHELNVLAELADRARKAGVQVMIEGPGHVPLNQIQAQVQMEKELCKGAPFYVLGPLVTDVAPGYDHINAAIGGAVAGMAGADFLCYVTPTEHLSLPTPVDVREGVIVARIAAHAADIARGLPGAADWDRTFSEYREARDWQKMLSECLDPKRAGEFREHIKAHSEDTCSMCGDFCVFKVREKAKR
ncbi:MAG: phosphomethylpyrimidine synthase ThiC [Planctomycetes bacterium]|nr:phosphomethylpyrimidine synthase ThiC [Planctomycetota bacterium]